MSRYCRMIYLLVLVFIVLNIPDVASAQEKRVQVGSILNITVLGYPELSGEYLVRQDGTTDYLFLSNVPIDGTTVNELYDILLPILARNVERPRLFISVSDNVILFVRVVGAVRAPNNYQLEGPVDIQSVITQAGGTTDEADLRQIKILRMVNGTRQILTMDLVNLMQFGDDDSSIVNIEDGDIIIVPTLARESFVRVIGAVNDPGSFVPLPGDNVIDIIYRAGGFRENGDQRDIRYIYYENDHMVEETIDLHDLLSEGSDANIPLVVPGSMIVIPRIPIYRSFSFWAALIRDMAYLTSAIVVLTRI